VAAWLKRFGLHLAAAVGATGVFVAAAAVGAHQTREQTASLATPPPVATVVRTRTPRVNIRPERSLAGTIRSVEPDGLQVVGVGGREWRVEPAPGALVHRNGRTAKLEALQPGDGVVVLGQAESGPGLRFLAHAITARAK
jgi:hypothetical protein